jgi:hypothetical protein
MLDLIELRLGWFAWSCMGLFPRKYVQVCPLSSYYFFGTIHSVLFLGSVTFYPVCIVKLHFFEPGH